MISLSLFLLFLQVSTIVFAGHTAKHIKGVRLHQHKSARTSTTTASNSTATASNSTATAPDPTPAQSPLTGQKAFPFGFGSQVTGGGDAPPQSPKDTAQLEAWLADNVPRVILIKTTYDFSGDGNVTANGCQPWNPCKNGMQVQSAIDFNGWCKEQGVHNKVPVQVSKAPLKPLLVGSHKTLLGSGKSAIIKGKGLLIYRSQNVVVQNIHITDLNPHAVWGGDGVMLDTTKDIWIDHCTFSFIGRQMIVSGGHSGSEANTGITISNNLFSGETAWSARCQNRHYWTVLFSGADDQITMARNCIDSTSGRSPKVGGSGNPKVALHYYNNLHTNIVGETFEVCRGSDLLAEGNVFKNVKIQDPDDVVTQSGGRSYVPFTAEDATQCQSALGRSCVTNLMIDSSAYKFGLQAEALTSFGPYPEVSKASVLSASAISDGIPGGCGAGTL